MKHYVKVHISMVTLCKIQVSVVNDLTDDVAILGFSQLITVQCVYIEALYDEYVKVLMNRVPRCHARMACTCV